MGVATQTTYLGLIRRSLSCLRRFGASRPYLIPCNPARFLLLRDTLCSQQVLHATCSDDFCRVVVGMVGVSTALTDKPGLGYPVVLVNVATLGTLL